MTFGTVGAFALALALAAGAAGCGDDDAPLADPDAAAGDRRALEVLDPPGDQLGVAFGETAELRVRYVSVSDDEAVAPVAGAEVAFAFEGDPAGSSLSSARVATDAAGVARVSVTGGATRTDFRVRAQATGASDVLFYVAVANEGFASFLFTPRHEGARPLEHFTVVEARLYGGATPVTCAELDAAAPPPSPYPPRSMSGWDQPVTYPKLPANEGYAVLVWGRDDAGHVLADGCVALAAPQVPAGAILRFDVVAVDRKVALAEAYALSSTLDLGPAAADVFAGRTGWGVAACALGPAQLLLDCLIDALDAGDPDDCVIEAPGALADALENARGPLDPEGCRPMTTATGVESADARLYAALTADGPAAPGARFKSQASALSQLLDALALDSTLAPAGAGAEHALEVARLDFSGAELALALAATPRPVVLARDVPLARPGDGLALAIHGFTLRLGALVREAFVALVLEPEGLGLPPEALGTALVDGARLGARLGCGAVSEAACSAAEAPSDCLVSACAGAAAALDVVLAAPFGRLDGAGLDLTWSGAAAVVDDDHDLLAESLASGVWSGTLVLGDGAELPVTGSFTGTAGP